MPNLSLKGVRTLALIGILTVPIVARGAPVIFASQDNVLFRISGITVDVFPLSNNVTALDFDDSGNLWATGLDDSSPNGSYELYRINNPFGIPNLQLISDGIPRHTPSIEWVGNTLYGVHGTTDDPTSTLVTITPGTGATAPVGATGSTGNVFGFPGFTGFQGITVESGTMWGISTDNPGTLQTIDWTLSGGPEPTATLVAPMGAGIQTVTSGLDHDPDTGDLWAMIRHGNPNEIGVFTVDKVTGNLTEQYDLSAFSAVRGASGIALIPEPATLMLLALGAAFVGRRRQG